MTTSDYMLGRKKYQRPQAMLWSENSGTLVDGMYVPNGIEIGQEVEEFPFEGIEDQFLILSDDNRSAIDFKTTRIENRKRMVNGRMRSYHIADKLAISVSWDMLPSRSFNVKPNFSAETGSPTSFVTEFDHDNNQTTPDKLVVPSGSAYYKDQQYTTDGGAGGVEMLSWYENHKGPFWVYLAYDKYSVFGNDSGAYDNLGKYNQIVEMYIAEFDYSVVRRGGSNYDFWNISVTLEEV